MKRRGRFLVVLLLVLISLISLVYAISVTYTYTTVSSGVNARVYTISDKTEVINICNPYPCASSPGNMITINYPGSSPSADYYTYHYKQGYLPLEKTKNIDWSISTISRQSSCKSQISSVNAPSSANKDEQFTITVNLNDITSLFSSLSIPTFMPSELSEYYKADTNVKLYIDNVLIETKPIKISTTGNNLQFITSISTAGSHNIKIETEVTDDQCSSYLNPQTSLATITITQPSNPCTSSDWSCSDWLQCTNSRQTRTCTKTTSCTGETGKPIETQSCTQCSDSYDNDNDGKTDYPNDHGCSSLTDNDETYTSPKGPCDQDNECKKSKVYMIINS